MICLGCGCVFCDDSDYPSGKVNPRKYCSRQCKLAHDPARRRMVRLAVCAAREKVSYSCMEDARDAAGWLMLRQGVVTYPYMCPCGSWHLSKQLPGTYWPEEETG